MRTILRWSRTAVALAVVLVGLGPAAAQPATEAFKGKTVTIYVGYGPGGGFDLYGRLVARHIGRYIPGEPTVVTQNMPGAGSLRAANFVFNAAPKDGTVFGMVTSSVALEEAMGNAAVKYKAAEFNWIGRMAPIVDISLVWHGSRVKTIADAMRFETPIAGSGPGSTSVVYPMVLNHVVGTKFKVITGYAGSTEGMLAMERGETEGAMTAWDTLTNSKQDWIAEKKINVIVQYVPQRIAALGHVPTVIELGRTEEDRRLLALFASGAEIGRSVMAPPGVPADRVAVLRAAFAAMTKDRELLAEIERTKSQFEPLSGVALQKAIEQATNIPPAILERARAARGQH